MTHSLIATASPKVINSTLNHNSDKPYTASPNMMSQRFLGETLATLRWFGDTFHACRSWSRCHRLVYWAPTWCWPWTHWRCWCCICWSTRRAFVPWVLLQPTVEPPGLRSGTGAWYSYHTAIQLPHFRPSTTDCDWELSEELIIDSAWYPVCLWWWLIRDSVWICEREKYSRLDKRMFILRVKLAPILPRGWSWEENWMV